MVTHLHNFLKKGLLPFAAILFFGVSQTNAQSNLGTLDNMSLSCNLNFAVCDGDTVRLAPTNTTGFTNFQWYKTSVSVANEINGADLARGVHAVSSDTLYAIATGGTYILTAEYSTPTGCMALNDTITLDFQAVPDLTTTPDAICVGNGETSDLTTLVTDANSVTGTTSWFASLADAEANSGAIATTVSPVSTTKYYVRKSSDGTGACYAIDSTIVTVNPMPTATAAALTLCETTSGGGTGVFTLGDATTTVLNGQSGMTVTYHASQANADNNASAITSSTSADGTIVYARVENSDGCYATSQITLNIDPLPTATAAALTLCETTSGGATAVFTLADATTTALNGQTGMTVTYHTSQADADSNSGAITSSTSADGTIVYARIENADNCYATAAVTLNVDPLPTATAASLTECETTSGGGTSIFTLAEATTIALNGQAGMTVTYHASQADADNNASAITTSTSSNGIDVYVRVENADGCYATAAVTLNVDPLPTATAASLTLCETTSSGGTADFSLANADSDALNGQSGMTVTYHASQADADNDASPITTNTASDGDIVYVRVENSDGCYATAEVTLNIDPLPTATPASLTQCETTSGGLTSIFTLSEATTTALNGQTGMTVTYHASQADADNDANAITSATVSDGTDVYVRIENADACYATAAVTLNVDALPTATAASLTACETTPGGLTSVFTLADATTQALNGQTGMTVTYHASQADADGAANAITSSTSINGIDVYVRVESAEGCYATAAVALNVNTRPVFTLTLPATCAGENPTVQINLGTGVDADPNVSVNGGTAFSYSTLTGGLLEAANGITAGASNSVVLTNSTGCDATQATTTPAFAPEVCIPLTIDVFRK